MEKENLDDLMREKFDTDDPGARFEFREEYWEQAQAMLEADERKRKRRFLWWWWLGAGCLLLAVGGWFGYAHRGGSDQPGAEPTTSLPKTNDATNAQTTNELSKKTDDSTTKPIESRKANDPADQSAMKGTTTADGTPTAAGNQANQNTPAAQSGQADVSARQSATGGAKTAGNTRTAAGNRAKQNTQAAQLGQIGTAGGKSPISRDGQQPKSSGLLPATTITPQPTGLPVGTGLTPATATLPLTTSAGLPTGDTGLPATTTAPQPTAGLPVGNTGLPTATSTGLPAGNTGLPPTAVTPQPTGLPVGDVGDVGNMGNTGNMGNIGILGVPPMPVLPKLPPIDFQLLLLPPDIPLPPKAPQAVREVKPLREPRFSVGIGAAVSVFRPKKDARWVGGTAGVAGAYRFYKHFWVSAGAAWRYIPATYTDTVSEPSSAQLRYSFGYEQTFWQLRPTGLHALEFPLGIRWHWREFALKVGAAPTWLLAVRADLQQTRRTSLTPLETSTQRIWADKKAYRQSWVSPFAGLEWGSGRLKLTAGMQWMPSDVLYVSTEPGSSARWLPLVDLGLRFKF